MMEYFSKRLSMVNASDSHNNDNIITWLVTKIQQRDNLSVKKPNKKKKSDDLVRLAGNLLASKSVFVLILIYVFIMCY